MKKDSGRVGRAGFCYLQSHPSLNPARRGVRGEFDEKSGNWKGKVTYNSICWIGKYAYHWRCR